MEKITTSATYNLSRQEVVDRSILKKDYYSYHPNSLATINTTGSMITINIPREESYTSLRNSYLEIDLDVIKAADDTRYVDDNGIQLNSLGGIALFSEYTLRTSSKKTLERVDQAYIASLMYKMLSSSDEEMMTNFRKEDVAGGIEETKRNRLINDNNSKGTMIIRVFLSDIFGYAEHQDKTTDGFGYSLVLKRADDGNAIFRTIVNPAKIVINDIAWYVNHDVPSIDNQNLVNQHVLEKIPTTISYVQRDVFVKGVNSNNVWKFEMGVDSTGIVDVGSSMPVYVIIGFQSTARFGPDQTQNNGVFDRLDIIEAHCTIGTDRYPDTPMQFDYDRNKYNDGYHEVLKFYHEYIGIPKESSTPYISFSDFKNMYNLYLFDFRAQKEYIASQKIIANFKFRAGFDAVDADYQAVALVLSNKVISISSDGQKQFDIM